MRTFVGCIGLAFALTGCGDAVLVTSAELVGDPYDGPLFVEVTKPDHKDVLVRSGAAGRALECDGKPYNGSTGYNWGVDGGRGDAAAALGSFIRDAAGGFLASQGYRVEREGDDRVLFSYDVGGRTRVAVIVADKPADDHGDAGWVMETYASCDPAEFDPATSGDLDIEVWTEKDGNRVPVSRIQSQTGPEHCDWQSVTFLRFEGDVYVRDPEGVLPADWFTTEFEADAVLPDQARDTGLRNDGMHLWRTEDGSSVYVVDGDITERWPLATQLIGCA